MNQYQVDPGLSVIFVMLVSCCETDAHSSTTIIWNQARTSLNLLTTTDKNTLCIRLN